jgi:hypothetical protein
MKTTIEDLVNQLQDINTRLEKLEAKETHRKVKEYIK